MVKKLEDLQGVGPRTIEQLRDVGVNSLSDLAKAEVEDIAESGISEGKAEKLKMSAKEMGVIIQTGSEALVEHEKRKHIPTGIETLDEILGGGWEEGFIQAISGASGTGKTQVIFKSMVNAVEETGKPALYIETEPNRYRPDRLQKLSSDPSTQEDIYLIQAYDLEQQEAAYGAIKSSFDEVSLIVIDSFTSQFRLSEEYGGGRGTFKARSDLISKHIKDIQELALRLNAPVLLSAQVYGNPTPFTSDYEVYGGSVFMHSIGSLVRMSKKKGLFQAEMTNHPSLPPDTALIQIEETNLIGVRE